MDGIRMEECTPRQRWLEINEPMRTGHRLQQAWSIIFYKDGNPQRQEIEWRDVPFDAGP